MTDKQRAVLKSLIQNLPNVEEFHFGDCQGADDQAATMVATERPSVRIIGHPPSDDRLRANNPHAIAWRPAKPYLQRNLTIIESVDRLIATPQESFEPPARRAGGTWFTVRQARLVPRVQVTIIYPNGEVESEL
jgi:hypothetical protein